MLMEGELGESKLISRISLFSVGIWNTWTLPASQLTVRRTNIGLLLPGPVPRSPRAPRSAPQGTLRMSITVALNHVTSYTYNRPASLGTQTIRLRPAPHVRNAIQSYSLQVLPKNQFINWQQDPFGNFLARVVFPENVKQFRVEVDLVTEIRVFNPFDFFLEPYAETFPFTYEAGLREELAPYLEVKERGGGLMDWLESLDRTPTGIINFLVAVNQKLNQTLGYTVRLEPGIQSCEETLSLGTGSCRDMADRK